MTIPPETSIESVGFASSLGPTFGENAWLGMIIDWVIFALVPAILASVALILSVNALTDRTTRDLERLLQATSQRLLTECSEEAYVHAWFRRATGGGGERVPRPARAHLLIGSGATDVPPILEEFRAYLATSPGVQTGTPARWQNVLGWTFEPERVKARPGRFFAVRWYKETAWLIWRIRPGVSPSTPPRAVDLIVAVVRPPSLGTRLAHRLAHPRPGERTRGGLFGIGKGFLFRHAAVKPGALPNTASGTDSGRWTFRRVDGRLALLERLSGTLGLYLQIPTSHDLLQRPSLPWLVVTTCLLLFSLLHRFWLRDRITHSLRARVLGMLGSVVLFPCLIALQLESVSRSEREESLRADWSAKARYALLKFDGDLREEEVILEKAYWRLRRDRDLLAGRFSRFWGRFGYRGTRPTLDQIEVFDWNGRSLFEAGRFGGDPGVFEIRQLVAKRNISQFLDQPVEKLMNSQERIILDMMDSPDLNAYFDLRIKRLQEYSIGRLRSYLWADIGDGPASGPIGFTIFQRFHPTLLRAYFRRRLVRPRPFRLAVHDRESGVWLPGRRQHPDVQVLSHSIWRGGEAGAVRFFHRGRPWLATGILGRRLVNHVLIAVAAEDRILREGEGRSFPAGWGLVLALVVTGACIRRLSSTFLEPVRDLETGIQALQERNLEHRIPVRTGDELGQLSAAFNHLLETSGELDVARLTQETLIPKEFPRLDGFRFASRYLPSRSIGGDYLDVISLSDASVVLMMGDIAGHGVDSALLMAMVKAIVAQHFREGRSPVDLLPCLDACLLGIVSRRRFMTACLVHFDPARRQGTVFSAGNPYPLLSRPRGSQAMFLGQPRLPLGTRVGKPFPATPFVLESGDALLLYTDGLIEASGHSGHPFGYERLREAVMELGTFDPELLCARLERRVTGPGAKDAVRDDISLLCLARECPGEGDAHG